MERTRQASIGHAAAAADATAAGPHQAGPPAAAELASLGGWLRDREVDTVECVFPDMWGSPCGKRLTVEHFLTVATTGFSVANAPLAWTIAGEIIPLAYANASTGFPNMRAVPDLTTLRLTPWRPGGAICIVDTRDRDARPMSLDTRAILRAAVERLARTGHAALVATELEFHLCDSDWQPVLDRGRSYAIGRGLELEPLMREIRQSLELFGMPVESSQAEYGASQFEIQVGPSDPVTCADRTMIFKYVVKELAARRGLRATFMPCPFPGANCSGLHVHQSLQLLRESAPSSGAARSGSTPTEAAWNAYLGGILQALPGLTAVLSPTINSYKRSVDYSFAANRACWGYDNRTVAVRVLSEPGDSPHAEIRTPASDANPYLAVAVCVGAGALGIETGAPLPPAVDGDAYLETEPVPLPRTFERALERLQQDELAVTLLGREFVDSFGAVGAHELDLHRAHVSDWERSRYLEDA